MRITDRIRRNAPRFLLTVGALIALFLAAFAPMVSADTASYSATDIHDWLVDQLSSATVEITDATSVILQSSGSEGPYMRVDGISLKMLGVTIGLSPIKFIFDGTQDVLVRTELDMFGISPAPKLECVATVGCDGPGGPVEITGIDAASVKIGTFEPTLSADDLTAITDVINKIIVASELTVTAPEASLIGITVRDDGDDDDLQLSWSVGDDTYVEAPTVLAKFNGMAGRLESKATDYMQAGEGDWSIDVDITSNTSLDIFGTLSAYDVTATVDLAVVFSDLTATIADATFTIGDDAPKTVTFSTEALVGCSSYIPSVQTQSFSLGDEQPDLRDYVAEIEDTICSAIDDAVDDVVEYTRLDLPFYTIEDIAVVGYSVVLTEGAHLVVGDVNMDGRVTMADVMFLMQYRAALRELDADQLRCADTTADGQVTMADAMHIMQFRADPHGTSGILYKPLFDPDFHAGMIDPLSLM